jgi:predicted nucleic acid-binding protein
LDDRRAGLALADLASMPLARASHRALVARIWDLRADLTPYDAAYVALAELLDSVLVSADRRLGRASGIECVVEVLH